MSKTTDPQISPTMRSSYPALLRAARKAQEKAREMGLEPVVREDEPTSATENGSTTPDNDDGT